MNDLLLAQSLLIGLIAIALIFDFLNGLHDAANSIATIVSTRVLPARYAVFWAAFFNFIAFLFFGLHVAQTLGTGIVDPTLVDGRVIFAALTVKYRDFRVVVPLLVQLGMFLTPAIYDQSGMVDGRVAQAVHLLNPVNGVVLNFRAAVLGGPLDWASLGSSAAIGLVLFAAGSAYFRRVERGFADVI